jgi:Mg/Co/Ni transporter MgtE
VEPSLAPDPLPIAAWLRERLPEDLAGYEPSPEIRRALQAANPIDLAHAFRDLEPAQRLWVFDHLAPESRAAVLAETDPESQAELLLHIGEQGAAELLARLNPDDAADILNVLDPPAAESILRSLEAEEAAEIRELRRYPADSAGSLMTPDVIAVPPEAKESEVLRKIRQNPDVETINII